MNYDTSIERNGNLSLFKNGNPLSIWIDFNPNGSIFTFSSFLLIFSKAVVIHNCLKRSQSCVMNGIMNGIVYEKCHNLTL